MRSLLLFTAISALALNAIANPIPLAEKLRAEGRSEHDILAQLGARHPTPSLGESDLLTTSLFRRAALPEPAPAGTSRAKTVAIIKDVIYNTIHNARRGLEYVGVARAAEPEPSDAYEGMIDQVRKPDYKIRLRA